MVRILHVLGHVPIGGVGTFLINSLKNLNTREIKFDFVMYNSNYQSTFIDEASTLGSNVRVFDSYLRFQNLIKMKVEFDKYLSNHNDYNIIHLHAPNLGFIVFPIAKKHGISVRILHSHNTKYSVGFLKSMRNFILDMPNKYLATDFVACSKEAGDFLFKKKPYMIIPNGISVKKFAYNKSVRIKMRREMGVEDKLVIGHIGNFNYQKNHGLLIDIFNRLHQINNKCELYLVGDGILEKKIYKKVKELNLEDSVKFMGRRSDVNNLVQVFDVFVLPSKFEGFGIVCIEAQASGLQCIVSKNVPVEVRVTNNISFLDINSSIEEWSQLIISKFDYERKDMSDRVKEAGYDIEETSVKLQRYYLNLKRNR
jgi:glycosyltransferase involved in cell wall biosynthesis